MYLGKTMKMDGKNHFNQQKEKQMRKEYAKG